MHPQQNSRSVDHFEQALHFITPGFSERGCDLLKPVAIHQVEDDAANVWYSGTR